jgi:uncharacterized protein (DUF4415 family)
VRRGLPIPKTKIQSFAETSSSGGKQAQVTLRIDRDVLEWFKAQRQGYQTQINQLLRAYMEAHQQ